MVIVSASGRGILERYPAGVTDVSNQDRNRLP